MASQADHGSSTGASPDSSTGPLTISHLGHACVLVEVADRRILVDPGGFSDDWHGLTDLDAIVVTHQHPDHLDPEHVPDLVRANPDAVLLVEEQARAMVPDLDTEAWSDVTVVQLGAVTLRGVGSKHAIINEFVPRVGNTGVLITAGEQPTFFHPGDAYDGDPGDVGVLALPINAPWCASKETIAFVRRIAPRFAFPVHDALLSARGRTLYCDHARNFSLDSTELVDLAGGEPRRF